MKKNLQLKTFFFLTAQVFLICYSVFVFGQNAGISPTGIIPPNAASGLDVNFIDKGLLIPRVTLTATNSSTPIATHVAGMIIYNTATAGDVVPGFYFNDGIKWVSLIPKANSAGDMQYWNGTTWITITAGLPGQRLKINASGVPAWAL